MSTQTPNLRLRKPDPTDTVLADADVATNFTTIDSLIGFALCTSGSRPANPFEGLKILETDTGIVFIYLSSEGWYPMGGVSAPIFAAKGFKASTQNSSGVSITSTNVETLVSGLSTTFTAETGRRYLVEVCLGYLYQTIGSVQPHGFLNVRWASGSSVSTSGTLLNPKPFYIANIYGSESFFVDFVPNVSGSVTVGVCLGLSGGSDINLTYTDGNVSGTFYDRLFIRDIGPSNW